MSVYCWFVNDANTTLYTSLKCSYVVNCWFSSVVKYCVNVVRTLLKTALTLLWYCIDLNADKLVLSLSVSMLVITRVLAVVVNIDWFGYDVFTNITPCEASLM